jgi:hypothetical protein
MESKNQFKLLFFEDQDGTSSFVTVKEEIVQYLQFNTVNIDTKNIEVIQTYNDCENKIKSGELSHQDIVSIDSRLDNDLAGEDLIRTLIDEEVKCFIIWHSSLKNISMDLLTHVLAWEQDKNSLIERYNSWINGEYKRPRSYAKYLAPILILCQGFIVAQAKENPTSIGDTTRDALNRMKLGTSHDLTIDLGKINVNTPKCWRKWWQNGLGVTQTNKDLFSNRLAQEQSVLTSLSVSKTEEISLKNSLNKLIEFILSENGEIEIETVVKIYSILSKYFSE